MMDLPEFSDLKTLLENVKTTMVKLSGQSAERSRDWDTAQRLLQWAREIDLMLQEIPGRDHVPSKPPQPPSRLPHYYVQNDKMVKVGASRDRGTYEHRVPRKSFDLVVQKLLEFSALDRPFETQRLVDRCDIPKHEPLIVVNVLAEYGLLVGQRRGRWAFANASQFSTTVESVWAKLPRN